LNATLLNTFVFIVGHKVLLSGLTKKAYANAWVLGTVRLRAVCLFLFLILFLMLCERGRECDDERQILLTLRATASNAAARESVALCAKTAA
jgi:hypothetical protein